MRHQQARSLRNLASTDGEGVAGRGREGEGEGGGLFADVPAEYFTVYGQEAAEGYAEGYRRGFREGFSLAIRESRQ